MGTIKGHCQARFACDAAYFSSAFIGAASLKKGFLPMQKQRHK